MSDDNSNNAEEGGSKILLILGILIGVAIGGGVVYTYLDQQNPKTDEEKQEEEIPTAIEYEMMEFKKMAAPVYTMRRGKPYEAGNFILDFNILAESDNYNYIVKFRTEFQQAFLSALNKNDVMQDGSMSIMDYGKASDVLTAAAKSVVGAKYVHKVVVVNAVKVQ